MARAEPQVRAAIADVRNKYADSFQEIHVVTDTKLLYKYHSCATNSATPQMSEPAAVEPVTGASLVVAGMILS